MGLLGRGRSAAKRRASAAAGAPAGPLRDLLTAPELPRDLGLDDLPLLAVDVETTGLDASRDRLLSIGFVPVDGRRIGYAGARRIVIRPEARSGSTQADSVGQSATIHGLTDDVLADGVPLGEALDELFAALTGRILLAHYCQVELGFVGAATQRLYGVGFPVTAVDTMELHVRVLTEGLLGGEPQRGALRLWAARARFGLPRYRAHEALIDALACAELYLAQTAELESRGHRLTLGSLSH